MGKINAERHPTSWPQHARIWWLHFRLLIVRHKRNLWLALALGIVFSCVWLRMPKYGKRQKSLKSSPPPPPPYVVPSNWTAPTYFTNQVPMKELLDRLDAGIGGLFSTASCCRLASWIYPFPPLESVRFVERFEECPSAPKAKVLLDASTQLTDHNHVIFLHLMKVGHFVEHMLNDIQYDVILWISSFHRIPKPLSHKTMDALVAHPHVIKVFITNLGVSTHYYPYHSKLISFPYGMKHLEEFLTPYHKVLKQDIESPRKDERQPVFAGYLASTNPLRKEVPSSDKKLSLGQYYEQLVRSTLVISPDGDRPDCYRHYEVIGLGAVPVTQLDPRYYGYFGDNVVYQNANWSLEYLHDLAKQVKPPNRRLGFEEYWMEYMEQNVKRPLVFWSTKDNKRKTLAEWQGV